MEESRGFSGLGEPLRDLTGGVPIVSNRQSSFLALVAQIGLQGPNPFVFMVRGS